MGNIIRKIIILLFEKYAYDYWIDIQDKKQKEEFIKEHKLEGCSEEEFNEYWLDYHNKDKEDAYDAGVADGINKAIENNLTD